MGDGASVTKAMGVQAEYVTKSLKSALAAVERAKEAAADEGALSEAAADEGARSSRDEEEEDRERAGANVGTKDAGDARGEAT